MSPQGKKKKKPWGGVVTLVQNKGRQAPWEGVNTRALGGGKTNRGAVPQGSGGRGVGEAKQSLVHDAGKTVPREETESFCGPTERKRGKKQVKGR